MHPSVNAGPTLRPRETTPATWTRRGWLRGLCEEKLGQADSRQAESGRGSRVVQAFSAGSSPLETTPKPVAASPVCRRSILKSSYRLGNFIPVRVFHVDHPAVPFGGKARDRERFGECFLRNGTLLLHPFLLVSRYVLGVSKHLSRTCPGFGLGQRVLKEVLFATGWLGNCGGCCA